MRLLLLSIFLTFTSAYEDLGRFNEHRELTPNDVGAYHTDAFEKLGEIYESNKPKSKVDIMMDMSNILSAYCPKDLTDCNSQVHRSIIEQFHEVEHGQREIVYPNDFDEKAKESLELVLAIVNDVNENNVDDIVKSLYQIQTDLESMEDPKGHIAGAIASASVAIESTKLWHSVHTDPDHNLHETMTNLMETKRDGDRRTQVFYAVNTAKVIEADVLAAITAFVTTEPSNLFELSGFEGPKRVYTEMILAATAASAAAAVNTTESDFLSR